MEEKADHSLDISLLLFASGFLPTPGYFIFYVFVLNLCLRARGPEVGKREGSEIGRKGRA